jgi:hypothetical protein
MLNMRGYSLRGEEAAQASWVVHNLRERTDEAVIRLVDRTSHPVSSPDTIPPIPEGALMISKQERGARCGSFIGY